MNFDMACNILQRMADEKIHPMKAVAIELGYTPEDMVNEAIWLDILKKTKPIVLQLITAEKDEDSVEILET